MVDKTLEQRVSAFLEAHHVFTLATRVDGAVHAASLMYALDGLRLVWMSDPGSRHSVALEAHPGVSATIAPDYSDFASIRGLQIVGTARRLTSADEIARASAVMRARYGFLRALASGPQALRAAFEGSGFYVLQPAAVTLIDNTVRFGHKETLTLS